MSAHAQSAPASPGAQAPAPAKIEDIQVAQDGTITRTSEKIVEDGVIEVKQRYVMIKDTEALKAIVNPPNCQ